jgi:hypothetical protein
MAQDGGNVLRVRWVVDRDHGRGAGAEQVGTEAFAEGLFSLEQQSCPDSRL